MRKHKSPMGEPVKGAPLFGPSALPCLVGIVLLFVAIALFQLFLQDPAAFKINAAGLWLKLWNGDGEWWWIRSGIYASFWIGLWLFLRWLDKEDKKIMKELKDRHGK